MMHDFWKNESEKFRGIDPARRLLETAREMSFSGRGVYHTRRSFALSDRAIAASDLPDRREQH
ncbi:MULTISPECIES: hypothetical protein [unclassified Bradyrhizobium]|uniref:hypothetical protein n=1 Tax=unclassified Bradyrhizobium TaxID=2631580 RepID=UPI0028E62C63|nr:MULTISPECIES: hypothetical protein [unclassified Bradyrhizobium]